MNTIKKTSGIVFGYEHNWADRFNLTYTFVTVIARSRVLNEQRKSLSIRPIRAVEFSVLAEADQVTEILNWLRYWNSKQEDFVPIPIYSEPIRPDETGNMSALSHIDTNDIAFYKNTQDYTTEVIVIDKLWQIDPIIKNVSTVDNSYIELDSALGAAFQGETTIIYPVMRAIIADHSVSHLTNKWTSVSMRAQEVLDEDAIVGIGAS